ncbi:hypothetical protein RB195_017657 [Necator americanus]|uniref:M protein repeat protein n=1 Tax=Necator americanus TaxID=51031 RepID=A0ABR1C677_NECAM
MATNVAFYADRLAQKEHELNELQATFNRYKLKNKVKFDQLRKEVTAYCSDHGYSINEKENNALLLIRLAENELALDAAYRETESLRKEMSKKQMQLNDQLILIKNMEEQLRASQPLSSVEIQEKKRAAQMIDIDRIQQQMLFKDERIVELNNVILDKERQILDLQELCREQGEVASVTSQAARIVQKQWEERNRERREIGTETDSSLWSPARPSQRYAEHRIRGESPGRAVANRGTANTSPPPLDPSEVLERSGRREDDDDLPGTSNSFLARNPDLDLSFRKKNRKRVTFDLLSTAQAQQSLSNRSEEQFTQMVLELTGENERLRRELLDTSASLDRLQNKIDKADDDMTKVVREGKTQALKARAVAQARIKELEDHMAELDAQHAEQVDRLQTEIESLRSTREWEVEQNAQLREQLNQAKTKNHKLTEELDASEKTNRDWEVKVAQGEEFLDQLIEDLAEAEDIINYMERQKHSILDDVDKLKDAIIAQDQLIEILEADVVIYEEHIGILRESLGASKVDHRALLRSKAFETKLKALEKEKEQINRKSNEDRLRTKALDQKCRVLEEENEKLMEKVCEFEMRERDEADMTETCKQLEKRIREAEERESVYRADCELRIETARLEAERKSNEAARLLEELHDAQLKLSRRSLSTERRREEWRESSAQPGQTGLEMEVEQLRTRAAEQESELTRLREELEEMSVVGRELEQLKAKCAETAEELDTMRCTNFELMTKVETLVLDLNAKDEENQSLRMMYEKASEELSTQQDRKSSENEEDQKLHNELESARKELDDVREQKQTVAQELNTLKSTLAAAEASLASQRVDLGESSEKIERLESELFAARSELDNARLGLKETNAVKKELEQLREELEQERSSGRAKWEEVCKKVLEGESSSPQSRKNSLEVINKVQHVEYMTAFEEKITCLEKELQEARTKIEQDKAEKRKLKIALKQLRDKEKSESTKVLPTVEEVQERVVVQEFVQTTAAEAQQTDEGLEKLRNTIKELELENRLSRELNTEYNHTMLEMEKEVIALKAQITTLHGESEHFEMELKLHEMLEEELEKELSEARLKNQELSETMQVHEETLEHLNEQVVGDTVKDEESLRELMAKVSELHEKNKLLEEKLASTFQEMTANETALHQEQEKSSELYRAHSEEVRTLSISLEDARRTISDVEERLSETESDLAHSKTVVDDLRKTTEEKSAEVERLRRELLKYKGAENVQQTALLRAANTTSEVVASVLIGETESVTFDANQAEVTATVNVREPMEMPTATVEVTVPEANPRVEEETPTSTTAAPISTNTDLFAENLILRQCVNESNQMQKDLTEDVEKMWQLKTELENAVEALKGEIWSLNGQLKASILDREQLQDRVVQLDSSLTAEKKRADALDCELSEQTELTEKASRQAAEAENESNRRLAECLEMETRREQVEKAYAQLSEYYGQLQAAYNVIYAKMTELERERTLAQDNQEQTSLPSADNTHHNIQVIIETMISELHLESSENLDLHGKVLMIQKMLREKLAELEEHREAIAEHRRANEELHEQLQCLEEETHKAGGETRDVKARLQQLEGDLEWKQDECDSLRRRVDELQATIDQLVERNRESDTAKLATRQADVDSLFRANAELAHTNVRLQNEIDEYEEKVESRDEEQPTPQVEELQAELLRSQAAEASLRQQLEELRSRLSEAEGKLEEYATRFERQEQQSSAHQANEEATKKEGTTMEAQPSKVIPSSSLEESIKESVELRDEVTRLEAVEKLLNERIMCLEDQLLEGEERLQEIEEELMDEKKKVQSLETDKNALTKELEQIGNANQSGSSEGQWGWEDQTPSANVGELLKQLDDAKAELASCRKELEELQNQKGEAPSYELVGIELTHVRSELEQTRKELHQQKKLTELLESASNERVAATELEKTTHMHEMEKIMNELASVRAELQSAQHLLREKEETRKQQKEQGWGWEDSPPTQYGAAEVEILKTKIAELEESERQCKKTLIEQQSKIEALKDDLITAENCREELEDASQQVNELQRQLREMKKQVQAYSDEEERLKNRISELEKNTESSWGDDWNETTTSTSQTDDEKRELERSRDEAHQKVTELQSLVDQKSSALAEAEKELAELREKNSKLENERLQSDLQMTAAEDGWGKDWQGGEQKDRNLVTEIQRREEAEALAENLRDVAGTLREQVDELQEKLLTEAEKLEAKQTEIHRLETQVEQLQSVIASRTELQEAEHHRSECEMETLCEEKCRVEDELASAETEKIRLEEQLMASKMMCDDLKTELQLQKANSSELTEKYNDAKRRYEDAEATLLTVEAERDSLLERLGMVKSELEMVMKQIERREEQAERSDQQSLDEIRELQTQKEHLEVELNETRRVLEEKEVQNNLLKDSEARLLDSVDEFGAQAERYQQESERLQQVINTLEKERLALEEEIAQLRKNEKVREQQWHEAEEKVRIIERECETLESRICEQSSSAPLPIDTKEFALLSSQLETVTTERNELRCRLEKTEKRLDVTIQEKMSISRSYEQLRSRLAARRQAAANSAETSRRSSAVTPEVDIPEEPRRSHEPVSSSHAYYSHQAAEKDMIRRRPGHH